MSETNIDIETVVEEHFDEFMKEYELDTEASINDMLFEFFAEGFVMALNAVSEPPTED